VVVALGKHALAQVTGRQTVGEPDGPQQRCALAAARQHGECRHGEPLDSELGDLVRENPRAAFLYSRYDKSIGEAEMEGALKVSKKGFTLDNIELMDFLGETAMAAAIEAAVIKTVREKLKTLPAGRMGCGTREVGDLVAAAVAC
jgi:hypothetical protein